LAKEQYFLQILEKISKFVEKLIKQITGGDTITARFLYQKSFEFQPKFKLFLVSDVKPEIKYDNKRMWERINQIPFNTYIPEDKRDKNLVDKLKEEGEGILNWAIEGCLDWQKNGLKTSTLVKNTTDQYREEIDFLKDL